MHLSGPGRQYRIVLSALEIQTDREGRSWLHVRKRGRLSKCPDVLREKLLGYGVREITETAATRPARRTSAKWAKHQRFFLDWRNDAPRPVYGDVLEGTYGIPKLWAGDSGASSMRISSVECNLTHLGTGLRVTPRLVRIGDMKRLAERLLDEVPGVSTDGMPPAEILAEMKRVTDEFLETIPDEYKYELET